MQELHPKDHSLRRRFQHHYYFYRSHFYFHHFGHRLLIKIVINIGGLIMFIVQCSIVQYTNV